MRKEDIETEQRVSSKFRLYRWIETMETSGYTAYEKGRYGDRKVS
jgi:hypothetical protein